MLLAWLFRARRAALGLKWMMHVSCVFLPLVMACMGVLVCPAQHQHRGEMGCTGLSVEHPAADCLLLTGTPCSKVTSGL